MGRIKHAGFLLYKRNPAKVYFIQRKSYILEGTSIPSKFIPKRMTLATLADRAIRNTFTASFSSRRIL